MGYWLSGCRLGSPKVVVVDQKKLAHIFHGILQAFHGISWIFFSVLWIYPLVNIHFAIEHGPVEIVDFPINSMVIFHSYVSFSH